MIHKENDLNMRKDTEHKYLEQLKVLQTEFDENYRQCDRKTFVN